MESGRRAVESYWRWRLIDSVTSDEDKVAPVYKLEEICELLRSSHPNIVKELSEFILKRLDHKSPIVKQKALRLIKYTVGKCGTEFRREMQRHSAVIRQLLTYKGQLDPLKGDALNKAVRDSAQEAISAVFSADDNNKPAPSAPADLNRRIQGFGNTNFQGPSQDKKSFLSGVVDLGSATIKQGLSALTQGHSSLIKNEAGSGTYMGNNLRGSLNAETERGDIYEPVAYRSETQSASGLLKNQSGGPWNQDTSVTRMEISNEKTDSESKTREDRLVETVASSGGVRLQPTRDAIQRLQSWMPWLYVMPLNESSNLQRGRHVCCVDISEKNTNSYVRVKAVCVLESILRKKDDDHFSQMASYFAENNDLVLRCSESPQASLREKANKSNYRDKRNHPISNSLVGSRQVLSLLGGGQLNSAINSEKAVKMDSAAIAELPDLIDTGDLNDYHGTGDTIKSTNDQNIANLTSSTPPARADDLFGNFINSGVASNELKNDDDPFADVSFHSNDNKEHADIFSTMTVGDDKLGHHGLGNRSEPESIEIFASNSRHRNNGEFVDDILAGLSIDENTSSTIQKATSPVMQSESLFSGLNNHVSHLGPDNGLGSMLGSQAVGFNVNSMFPSGHLPYTMQPGIMLNQPYSSQPLNYGAMGNLLAQQQFLATMSNFQHLNNVNKHDDSTAQNAGPNGRTPIPDIFQSKFSTQTPSSMINSSKKEETKAFDFISDHLATAYDSRRMLFDSSMSTTQYMTKVLHVEEEEMLTTVEIFDLIPGTTSNTLITKDNNGGRIVLKACHQCHYFRFKNHESVPMTPKFLFWWENNNYIQGTAVRRFSMKCYVYAHDDYDLIGILESLNPNDAYFSSIPINVTSPYPKEKKKGNFEKGKQEQGLVVSVDIVYANKRSAEDSTNWL
ncbi:VHS domain-containing protein [Mucuna pruriens]|uniref:VHS domain-containing protein n=1 Tax=Mucuna pruriens TaxID=157652 RepID=A0A371HFL5_MUCPR|nr:VHS domain-containing protein [Mucuna pruriens]